jgi:hypothetical protein
VFAYEGGDRRRPRLAAGVALRGALRMFFTYRGSMFWRMRSGMGDAVFAPLYKVLSHNAEGDDPGRRSLGDDAEHRSRPRVTFHFHHELTGIRLNQHGKDRWFVTELTFGPASSPTHRVLRRVTNPGDEALDHFGCWPATPDHLLACDGSEEPVTLHAGEEFDVVVLAMGLDDFSALIRASDSDDREQKGRAPVAWRQATASPLPTVATKAAQVWLLSDLEELGWLRGSAIISALGHPLPDLQAADGRRSSPAQTDFDTWADMTHTLPSERAWQRALGRPASGARSVAYFCGVMPDQATEAPGAAVRRSLGELLKRIGHLWPEARDRMRVLDVHTQHNGDRSDRYSLSLPGRIATRLSPLDRTVLNATVAGDWTASGLDAGCVEAAVISGMLAAHAITGTRPTLESITGYDHP